MWPTWLWPAAGWCLPSRKWLTRQPGMLVLTSVVISGLGERTSLQIENLAVGARHLLPQVTAGKLILNIVRFTFVVGAAGAAILHVLWAPDLGWREAV